jgi:hypothetical protein
MTDYEALMLRFNAAHANVAHLQAENARLRAALEKISWGHCDHNHDHRAHDALYGYELRRPHSLYGCPPDCADPTCDARPGPADGNEPEEKQ